MNRRVVKYNSTLVARARRLRQSMTLAEVLLWQELKGMKLGYRFHRQKPLGNYIVDFFCSDLKLAIEIDGITHKGREAEDARRQREIEMLGVHVLRFWDFEVKRNLDGVVRLIREWIDRNGVGR